MKSLRFENGDTLPQLGLGTWKIAVESTREVTLNALEMGYRHIDCASMYGNEAQIGEALAEAFEQGIVARSDLWVTSKLWNDAHHPENVRPALERTLKDLRLDYLDLYLMHWPIAHAAGVVRPTRASEQVSLRDLPLATTWAALEKCAEAGLARHVGVANFSIPKLEDLLAHCRIKPVMNQVESHPYLQQAPLLSFCRQHGIHMTAYAPLGSGDRATAKPTDPVLMTDPALAEVARQLGASSAQVLIAWAMQRGTAVIPKSASPVHMKQNFDAQDIVLSAAQMDAIAGMERHHRLIEGIGFCLPNGPYTQSNLWNETRGG